MLKDEDVEKLLSVDSWKGYLKPVYEICNSLKQFGNKTPKIDNEFLGKKREGDEIQYANHGAKKQRIVI
jgi:hypothetical protein